MASKPVTRITSYNVCYTKLLRSDDTTAVLQHRLRQVGMEIQALQTQQRLLAGMLKLNGEGGPESAVDKEMFVAMLRADGMDDAAMKQLHGEFERRAPQAHHNFLLSLGISENEALQIRKWSVDYREQQEQSINDCDSRR